MPVWDDNPNPTPINLHPTGQAVKHSVWSYWVFYISPSSFTRDSLGLGQWGHSGELPQPAWVISVQLPLLLLGQSEIQIYQMYRHAGHLLLTIPEGCLTALQRTHTPRADFPGGRSEATQVQLLQVENLPCASGGPCAGSWPRLCPGLLSPWSVLSTQGEPPEK